MCKITTQELLDRILLADADELNSIIEAVKMRFQEVWPDWELLVISAEGHTPEEHLETLRRFSAVVAACIKK